MASLVAGRKSPLAVQPHLIFVKITQSSGVQIISSVLAIKIILF